MDQSESSNLTLKPGVESAYGNGWRQLRRNFLELFLIGIIALLVGIPVGMGNWAGAAAAGILSFFALVYGVLVNGPIQYGVAFAFLNAARGDQAGPQSSAGLCKVSGSSGQAASRPCISPLAGLYLSRAVHFGALQAEPQKMDSR